MYCTDSEMHWYGLNPAWGMPKPNVELISCKVRSLQYSDCSRCLDLEGDAHVTARMTSNRHNKSHSRG